MINRLRPWWKLICFVLVLIWYFILLMLLSLFGALDLKKGFRIRRNFCRAALRVFNIDLHLKGAPLKSNALYISNHRSMLDPLIELTFLEVYILSKSDVADYPMIGKGARKTGVFFVDRDSDNSRKAALQSIEKFLTAGF